MVVRFGVWRVHQAIFLRGSVSQVIQHTARLHGGQFPGRVDSDDSVHVLGEIHDDCDVAALAGQACAAAARQDGRAVLACQLDGCHRVLRMARNNNANRHLAVIGAIRGVERAGAAIESNLTINSRLQFRRQGLGIQHRNSRARVVALQSFESILLVLLPQNGQAGHG